MYSFLNSTTLSSSFLELSILTSLIILSISGKRLIASDMRALCSIFRSEFFSSVEFTTAIFSVISS